MNNNLLLALTLIKGLVILIGLGLALWVLIRGIMKKELNWKNKALKYFFITWLIVIILSIIDFGIA